MAIPPFVYRLVFAGAQYAGRIIWARYGNRIMREVTQKIVTGELFDTAKSVIQGPIIRKMDIAEAKEVLGVGPKDSYEVMIARFAHLYEANEPARGGSQYIQGKLLSAKEALDEALLQGKPL